MNKIKKITLCAMILSMGTSIPAAQAPLLEQFRELAAQVDAERQSLEDAGIEITDPVLQQIKKLDSRRRVVRLQGNATSADLQVAQATLDILNGLWPVAPVRAEEEAKYEGSESVEHVRPPDEQFAEQLLPAEQEDGKIEVERRHGSAHEQDEQEDRVVGKRNQSERERALQAETKKAFAQLGRFHEMTPMAGLIARLASRSPWLDKDAQVTSSSKLHSISALAIALSRDDSFIVTGSRDGVARIWDVASGQLRHALSGLNTGFIYAVAISSDGSFIVTGSGDGAVRIWDVPSEQLRHTLTGHIIDVVHAVALSRDGRFIAAGSGDGKVRIWDVASGQLRHTLSGSGTVYAVAISSDGSFVVAGSGDGKVHIWDVASGQLRRTLTGHTGMVYAVAVSSDDSFIVTGSRDGMVSIWDVASGELRHTLYIPGTVYAVVVSSDDSFIVTGSGDRIARIWDVASGQLRHTLTGHTDRVSAVAVSSDDNFIVTAGDDGTVRIWSIATSEPVESIRNQEESKLVRGGQVIEEESAQVEEEVKEEVAQHQPTVSASSSPASAINAAVFQAQGLLAHANRIELFPVGHLRAIEGYIQELQAADSVAKVYELSRLIAQEFESGKVVAGERQAEKKRR